MEHGLANLTAFLDVELDDGSPVPQPTPTVPPVIDYDRIDYRFLGKLR
jgi:hypothetical protein